MALALAASPAAAQQAHVFKGAFGAGELSSPAGLAIAGASGDVYVADSGTGMVDRFGPTGTPAPFSSGTNAVGPFGLSAGLSEQVAVDNSSGPDAGDFYVIDGNSLQAFDAAGEPAPFTATAPYLSGNMITGSTEGPIGYLPAVSVDSKGDIYLLDANASLVRVYAPSGEELTSFGVVFPNLVAPDSTGVTYAGYGEIEIFEAFTPSTYPPTSATTYRGVKPPFILGGALSVDPGSDRVYTSDSFSTSTATTVSEYEGAAAGNGPLGSFGAEQLTAGVAGLAVSGAAGPENGDVYVSTGDHVARFSPLVTLPDVVTGFASGVGPGAHMATLNGTVNPSGIETTECQFEYGLTAAYGQTVGCVEDATEIGSGASPVAVHADLTGLASGTYHFRLRAGNGNGSAHGGEQIFGPPAIESESATPGQAEAQLAAQLASGGLRTTYRFEYGTTASLGTSTLAATLAPGVASVPVSIGVVGLAPGTTYHFRIVATNSAGTVVGVDATFTTGSGAGASGCPNEALRIGPSAFLPECRAYEMVSPVDKNGGAVYPKYNAQSTLSGGAIEFLSTTAFPGAVGSNINAYIATRGTDGWTTKAIDAPQGNPNELVEFTSVASSEDLSKTLQVSREALTPGATPGGSNVYLRDNSTGARTLIATESGSLLFNEFGGGNLNQPYLGGTADWSRFFFDSTRVLAAGGVQGQSNIYEYANGRLSVPTVPEAGGPVPAASVKLSSDGHRLFLSGPGLPAVQYLSQDGAAPVAITVSHLAASEGQPQPVGGFSVSPDGSIAFFTSQEPLLEVGGQPVAADGLYRLDIGTGALTDLTPAAPSEVLGGMTAISDDGTVAYFHSKAKLTSDATANPIGFNLYDWQPAGFQFILRAEPEAFEHAPTVEEAAASPDGKTLAFTSIEPYPPTAARNPRCPGGNGAPAGLCKEVYVFSADAGLLSCASCNGRPDAGSSSLALGRPAISAHSPRTVAEDGAVFFNSPNALVPRDSNGVGDVYMWLRGKASLISTGTSPEESTFADASRSGGDVFFRTTQRLVGQDVDSSNDLYDARVDGGIASQNPTGAPAPCEGEDCRGAASSPPPPLTSKLLGGAQAGRCGQVARQARQLTAQAKGIGRQAGRAAGSRRKHLRHRQSALAKQAKHLNGRANQCRRQGK